MFRFSGIRAYPDKAAMPYTSIECPKEAPRQLEIASCCWGTYLSPSNEIPANTLCPTLPLSTLVTFSSLSRLGLASPYLLPGSQSMP